jgi:16S rRNA (guanine527-N7)-methyltransferase
LRVIYNALLMISKDRVRELLSPFDVSIPDEGIDKLIVYVDLLLRWNRKINLTSIANAEECVTRHFGESFLLYHLVELTGQLLDIGSGAGFPGLALKLLSPSLEVVLLEPVSKKRAFLKEVSRACGLGPIRVDGSRFEEFTHKEAMQSFDIITSRAVGSLELMVQSACSLLKPGGHLCLWLGRLQVQAIENGNSELNWRLPAAIPLSRDRAILVGTQPGL